jgi:hypothetical protein
VRLWRRENTLAADHLPSLGRAGRWVIEDLWELG